MAGVGIQIHVDAVGFFRLVAGVLCGCGRSVDLRLGRILRRLDRRGDQAGQRAEKDTAEQAERGEEEPNDSKGHRHEPRARVPAEGLQRPCSRSRTDDDGEQVGERASSAWPRSSQLQRREPRPEADGAHQRAAPARRCAIAKRMMTTAVQEPLGAIALHRDEEVALDHLAEHHAQDQRRPRPFQLLHRPAEQAEEQAACRGRPTGASSRTRR